MKTTLFAVLISVSVSSSAQMLPVVRGTSVSGQPVTLPDQAKGKVAVLVIGFSRGSSSPAGAWATRIKSDFARNSNVAIFRLAFLEEVPHMFRGLAIAGVRKSAGADDQDTVVPVFESEAVFKRLVKYWKPDDAYILVVDRNTEIRLLSSGDVQAKYVGVQDCVNHLLGEQPNPATR
jgi:ATP10 protein